MLLPTLTGIVAATPAHADPPPEQEWWNDFNGLGFTKLDMRADVTGDYWKAYAIVHPKVQASCTDASNNADTATDIADVGGGQTSYTPGSSANLCIDFREHWSGGGTGGAALDTFTSVTLKIKKEDGTTLPGSFVMNNAGGNHNQQSGTISVQMDAEPFDGAPDTALTPGWYEMYLELRTTSICTLPCTSNGDGNTDHYGRGFFYVTQGYLYGSHPAENSTSELTQEQASTGVNKNYSLVRDYKPDWATPSARVATWASEGKSVVWSAKPPAWSGSTSPWARASGDTTMIRSQIQSLQNSANQTGGPGAMFYAVGHEPHDNASDTTQGWHGGASDRKCGSATDPAGGTTPCSGTSTEYKTLYHAMKTQQQTSCNSTGGTTGTLGFACNRVQIIYIGVSSNTTPGATVGADDIMRPADVDFDAFGGDVFNWGCFRKTTGNLHRFGPRQQQRVEAVRDAR